jgi:hypothetical protein
MNRFRFAPSVVLVAERGRKGKQSLFDPAVKAATSFFTERSDVIGRNDGLDIC